MSRNNEIMAHQLEQMNRMEQRINQKISLLDTKIKENLTENRREPAMTAPIPPRDSFQSLQDFKNMKASRAASSVDSQKKELQEQQLSEKKNRILVMLHEIKDTDKKRFEKHLGEISERIRQSESIREETEKLKVLDSIIQDLQQTFRK